MLPKAFRDNFYEEDMAMMADDNSEASPMDCSSNLPDVVASMELLTVDSEIVEVDTARCSINSRYSMRKRIPRTQGIESLNRRCSIKPKKRSYSTMESDKDIREYYLDKNWKRNSKNTLETIYEEIDGMSENSTLISGRKFSRQIKFEGTKAQSDAKIRKRRAKIKRVFGSKMRTKSKSITMTAFLRKLEEIKNEQNSSEM